jgi:hypothetical protein
MMAICPRFRCGPAIPLSLASGAVAALCLSAPCDAATQAEVEAKLETLAAQVHTLQLELAQLKAEKTASVPSTSGTPAIAAANPSAPALATPSVASATAPTTTSTVPRSTTAPGITGEERRTIDWFGYGELNYMRPQHDSAGATADVGRFVLGASYRFDDRTRLISELEVEHAIASATDSGEVEVEQAWLERRLGDTTFAKLGLFLMPSGMLNESHEPTRYYGVFRNFVETAIIPSTWREMGVGIQGNTVSGLRWDVGVTTGFDLSRWNAASSDGIASPLFTLHQEGQLAHAGDLSGFVAANYTGVPGLRLGASIVAGDIAQGQQGFRNNGLALWETHARWTPGAWDLSTLYAHGHISNTAPINRTLVGLPVLIPESLYGWYAQAAYRLTLANAWQLAPFARFERVNTASGYAFIAAGLTPNALAAREIWTGGFNLDIAPGVVVKLDYQAFERQPTGNRIDLGLGYAF